MKVRLSNNNFRVRIGRPSATAAGGLSVSLGGGGRSGGGSEVERLSELTDVNVTNLTSSTNRFVLVYDAGSQSFKFVNPDEVVDAAVGTNTVPGGAPETVGLTGESIDYITNEMDVALDNKIDLDAGTF